MFRRPSASPRHRIRGSFGRTAIPGILWATILLTSLGLVQGTVAQLSATATNPGETFALTAVYPPTSLTASVSGGNIVLNWASSPSSFATGYNVLRSTTSGGPYSQIGQTKPATATSYTDTTVSDGVTYYYVLQSYFQNWTSANSNEANALVAPIALVQKATGLANGASSVSATLATTPVQNNLLVAVIGTNARVTINLPAGWSMAINQSGSPGQAMFYKIAGAAESKTLTVTVSASTRLGLHIYEYSNIATSSPLDKTSSATGSSTSVSSGTTATTTQAKELLIAGVVINASTAFTNASWTNSFVEENDFRNGSAPISTYGGADRVVSATGAYPTTATAGATGAWRGQVVTFKHK